MCSRSIILPKQRSPGIMIIAGISHWIHNWWATPVQLHHCTVPPLMCCRQVRHWAIRSDGRAWCGTPAAIPRRLHGGTGPYMYMFIQVPAFTLNSSAVSKAWCPMSSFERRSLRVQAPAREIHCIHSGPTKHFLTSAWPCFLSVISLLYKFIFKFEACHHFTALIWPWLLLRR